MRKRKSLPSRGVWIEIVNNQRKSPCIDSHSPHGECGLKLYLGYDPGKIDGSLPSRGVWIEMAGVATALAVLASLPSRGVWIEIQKIGYFLRGKMSLPSRGVWIEIAFRLELRSMSYKSLPSRGVWIEILRGQSETML